MVDPGNSFCWKNLGKLQSCEIHDVLRVDGNQNPEKNSGFAMNVPITLPKFNSKSP